MRALVALLLCASAAQAEMTRPHFKAMCFDDLSSLAERFGDNPDVRHETVTNGKNSRAYVIATETFDLVAIAVEDGRMCVLWSQPRDAQS